MCHGHPHYHSCGHQSVTWHYCPSALIDLTTGYETPCPNITFAASQLSSSSCPLANCDFRSTGGGVWTCCKCGGRNNGGWCKNMSSDPKWEKNPITNEWEWIERCDHGCCRNCVKDAPTGAGESSRKEARGGKESRKHRQNAASAVDPVAPFKITLDYSGKGGRGSTKKDKEVKSSSRRRK
ncbi:uncharacterized protein THITE_2108070 [Thermothielavioides terrestris NRRL 8126]|uniref:Uncharacterized protein n=2 Tax=Thermothielavioides terrestris TaxID=2587410 RepID=G2QXE5_THETT|nr:uncharacterized protein THITE_2108070 [Thermothielavioides terrestris NRRL 8126]AEO63168.1 hypothetical protein THITE_2108070 [Thermothielavioides terrestris NRRL 8126]